MRNKAPVRDRIDIEICGLIKRGFANNFYRISQASCHSMPTIYKHLKKLENLGIIEGHWEGSKYVYKLSKDVGFYEDSAHQMANFYYSERDGEVWV